MGVRPHGNENGISSVYSEERTDRERDEAILETYTQLADERKSFKKRSFEMIPMLRCWPTTMTQTNTIAVHRWFEWHFTWNFILLFLPLQSSVYSIVRMWATVRLSVSFFPALNKLQSYNYSYCEGEANALASQIRPIHLKSTRGRKTHASPSMENLI